jgi:uncharacterized membrane-anchored protein YhcB (DUF1043 family)
MPYMRIATNKFWAWVVVALLVGLGIGLLIMLARTGSLSDQIRVLRNQVAAAGTTSTASADVQSQLASDEASITALTSQNAQLTSDLAAANVQIGSQGSGSTTTTTTAPTITVTSRTITPSSVHTTGTITMTAKVTGGPSKVTMRVYNSSKSFDKVYTLKKISGSSSGTETWRATASAPTKIGTYSYYATATLGSQSVTKVGASPSTFTVIK